ncbi:UDP-N-acetylmuramoyl-tripeptide--D-alanyl-D-alanine ligase [Arthrobacter sp. I2-34]|uniref:UDP-N-acetylmuramoyl-tripeptide--D-alanyl-D-alanine ligase n=1 Tax=Arthrobacter hankyongi TaxID=2904801 RepID=A0ABS9LBJ9_9MICC|nr:UDP-N-acetylmuramoyl-tripeptide--D-alanyl-D-alanine ligase [Arthrobacter hankyongi]MCG2623849.1 UDP-N-acetylmuramoyl-tripeptide--D-alanyl-D-alanine ligase [Arthrobacter hankyongi]
MIELTAAEIAAITGGKAMGETAGGAAGAASISVTSATTDSREVLPGGLFVAKPGEESDGHLYVPAAFAAGAALALTEREIRAEDGRLLPQVVVPDSVLAMGDLAAAVLERVRAAAGLEAVGITGSAGKTTTKDLLAGILAQAAPTVAPVGSYNGEVGVPLTVFNTDLSTRYLVSEMGATGIGHIEYLARMVKPEVGVVLGVGTAHAGEFGGVENIARAKGELVEALAPAGTAVLNADDPRVRAMAARTSARLLYFTTDAGFAPDDDGGRSQVLRACDVRTTAEGHPDFTLRFPDGSEEHLVSGLIGSHHVANLLAAAAAAWALGIPAALIAAGLNGRGPQSRWRMERTERPDGVTIINDAYNANPESMRAALRTLAELGRSRRTWAVLGEMLELGDDSIQEHDALGRIVVRLNISRLIVVGSGAKAMHNAAVLEGSWGDESMYVETADEAFDVLQEQLRPGDLVLFKSSNGAGLRYLGDQVAAAGAAREGGRS